VGTSIYPTCWRNTVWRDDYGWSRPQPPCRGRTRPDVPNSVNILRLRETSGVRGDQTQTGSEAVECCLIEQ
jgi:hypothetical protein